MQSYNNLFLIIKKIIQVDYDSNSLIAKKTMGKTLQLIAIVCWRAFIPRGDLLCSQDTAYMLFGNLLTLEETKLEILNCVANIVAFVEQYVKTKTLTQKVKP